MFKWLKYLTPAERLVILTMIVIIAAVVILVVSPNEAETATEISVPSGTTSQAWGPVTDMVPMVDELPRTEMVEEEEQVFDVERVKLIGRLAKGIHKVRTMKGRVPFWFCGKPYTGEEAQGLAANIAWHIVTAGESASTSGAQINIWELAGLASNETGFDICSLGLYPRLAAYDYKILKRRRRTISHTREEIEHAISHPKMKARFRAFDLGMIQTLDSHYRAARRNQNDTRQPKDLLSWGGFRWQAEYFHGLMVRYNTKTPSLYWPGHKSPWKLQKVRQFAKQLGARPDELPVIGKR